ncbi:hypothetical protein JW905_18995 [bacterium]|nr:hypothetical protein [candidate division CSSED10-310 bacterium]
MKQSTPWSQPEIILLLLMFGLACVLFFPRASSDGAYYYEFVRSTVFDGDLNFFNERMFHTYKHVPLLAEYIQGEWQPTGYPPNIFTIGPALLWLLPYLVVHAASLLLSHGAALNGYELRYLLVPGLMSILQGYAGLLIIHRLGRRFFPPRSALFPALLLVAFASNLPAFLFVTPMFSHASSFFMVSLFLWFWIESRDRSDWRFFFLYGCVGGLATIMRSQNALFAVLPMIDGLIDLSKPLSTPNTRRRFPLYLVTGFTFLLFLTPQLIMTNTLYGTPFTDPQGAGGMRWLQPRFGVILFDSLKGLFIVNPIFLPACLGLPLLLRRHRRSGLAILLVTALQFYINAVRRDPFGVGFGMRRFINIIPMLVLGLAALIESCAGVPRFKRLLVGAMILLVPWNFLLMAQYYYSELGAPWIQIPGATMLLRQFTLSPRLLVRMVSESLVASSLIGNLDSFLTTLAVLLATGILLTMCARLYRFSRAELTACSQRTIPVVILTALLLVVDLYYLHASGATVSLVTADFSKAHMLGGTQLLKVRQGSRFSGLCCGLRLARDGVAWERADAQYDPNVFLAEGHYNWSRLPIWDAPRPIFFTIAGIFPIRALHLISYLDTDSVSDNLPLANLVIDAPEGQAFSVMLTSGVHTAPGAVTAERARQEAVPLAALFHDQSGAARFSYSSRIEFKKPIVINKITLFPRTDAPPMVITGLAMELFELHTVR